MGALARRSTTAGCSRHEDLDRTLQNHLTQCSACEANDKPHVSLGLLSVQLDGSSAGALHESLQALRRHQDKALVKRMQLLVTMPEQVHLLNERGCDS